MSLDPEHFYKKQADKLLKSKQFEKAVKILDKNKQIKKNCKTSQYWYNKGISYYDVGEFSESINYFKKELKQHESFDANFMIGKIQLLLKQYAESIESFNKALEVKQSEFLYFSHQENNLKKNKKFERALIYKDKSRTIDNIQDDFWYYMGESHYGLKKYNDAISYFEKSIHSIDVMSLYYIAKCYLFLKKPKMCISMLREAISLDPGIKFRLRSDTDFTSLLRIKEFLILIK